MSLSRLLEIVNLLMINKTLSANYLADYFEVSTRTIYRDVDKLTLANIPIYSIIGKNGGYSLLEGYTLNKQLLDKDEQLQIVNSLNENPLITNDTALKKLSALFNIEKRDWIKIDFKGWYAIEDDNAFLEIKDAILSNTALEFEYSNNKGITSKKVVYPYKVYFKSFGWYLVGFDSIINKARIYKITRIKKLKTLSKFNYSELNFIELDKLLHPTNVFKRDEKKVKVVLKIDSEYSYRVYDDFNNCLIYEDGNSLVVTIYCYPDDSIKRLILTYFDAIEIVEPLELKNNMKILLNDILVKI